MPSLFLENREFNDASLPLLIAEVGHNHQGNLQNALNLIKSAAQSGATAVKFQKRNNRTLFTKSAFQAPYVSENSFGSTYGEHREALEFGEIEYKACIEEAKKNEILFFATAFDFASADFLAALEMPAFKIASGDLKNIPLIKYVAKFGKPLIISTGGGTYEDIDRAIKSVGALTDNFAILQCTAGYPPKYEELNLNVIKDLRHRYPNVVIGYSGHDNGIAMSLAAYVLGARVIEKHFTLDRTLKGTDHSFSLEPQGMKKLSRDLERVVKALGDGVKTQYNSEIVPLQKMGKSVFYSDNFEVGKVVDLKSFALKSPGGGIPPYEMESLIGKKLSLAVAEDQMVQLEHFFD
jgi:N-acetylneuraminate synthase/sialic acid synthase